MSAYSADVLATSGLLSYWRLDEPSGTSAADSKGSNTGTYTGSPTLSQTGALAGDSDTAALFDGSTQYVTAAVTTTATDNVAIECWVKLTTTSTPATAIIFTSNGTDDAGFGVGMGDGAGGAGMTLTGLANSVAWVPTNYTFADTNYHHIVFTRESGTWKMYVDGSAVTVTAGAASTPIVPANNTVIAATHNSAAGPFARFAPATIDEVAVYNAAITAATALDHYTVGTTAIVPFVRQFNPIPFMR